MAISAGAATRSSSSIRCGRLAAIAFICALIFQLSLSLATAFAAQGPASTPPEATLRLGERMYREGVLPSGQLLKVKGAQAAPGTTFSCVSCHLRSGLGSVLEGVYTPAANGVNLFKPSQARYIRYGEKNALYFNSPIDRPPYTDATLAKAIRAGVDPGGRRLEDVMPRYLLDDQEMSVLISYLKSLSSTFSPGISDTSVRLATVITDDVPQEERDALLIPLQRFITARNNQVAYLQRLAAQGKLRIMANMMPPPAQTVSLSLWLLKGPAETWRSQLDEYYSKEPVFALVGGISNGDWKPMHQFSEDNQIPCLFPATDYPVISQSDWYTLYLSKGYYQEGEAAAGYLSSLGESLQGKPILQIVRESPEGRALAKGFREAWQDSGHPAPVTFTLGPGEALTEATARQLLDKERPGAVLLWDGHPALSELEALVAGGEKPGMIFVSASYLGKDLWSVKRELREVTYITYPFRIPSPVRTKFESGNPVLPFAAASGRGGSQAYAIAEVLTSALTGMRGNNYRDQLLDVISLLEGLDVPLYERLSFGPGQRYASRGCYIVQLSKDQKPVLIKKSDWVAGQFQ